MNKVLVVDDDEDIVDCVCMILQANGFDVVCLYDCRQVIKTVEEKKPDLILLDINLGFCDGRELCLELKERHLFKKPILLFSAKAEHAKTLHLYKADDFIEKPFGVTEFVKTIRDISSFVSLNTSCLVYCGKD